MVVLQLLPVGGGQMYPELVRLRTVERYSVNVSVLYRSVQIVEHSTDRIRQVKAHP